MPVPGHWDAVSGAWQEARPHALWRAHSDAVNAAWAQRVLPAQVQRLLKTDLFDEAFGEGLCAFLAERAQWTAGVDISSLTAHTARVSHPCLSVTQADVRRLPFANGAFDAIISNSTLDHFETPDDILVSLCELHRVLRAGGCLLLTLDNPANPAVALRNALSLGLLRRLGLVPYYVGATCGPRHVQRLLQQTGFKVREITAIMHAPRALAVPLATLLQQYAGPEGQGRFLRLLGAFERLCRWPTRFLSGHFVAVVAVRR